MNDDSNMTAFQYSFILKLNF